MKNPLNLKDLTESVSHAAHGLKENFINAAENIIHVAHDIAKAVNSLSANVESSLREKGITEISRETYSGNDTHNVVANGSGDINSNNDNTVTRTLFNHVLFSNGGESRLSNMADGSSKNENLLTKVKNPATEICSVKYNKFTSD
jgi:hypothetical protein